MPNRNNRVVGIKSYFQPTVNAMESTQDSLSKKNKIETKEVEIEDGNIDSIVESKESDLKESPLPELSTQTSSSSQPSSSSAEWPPLQYLTSDWKHELSSEFSKPYFRNLSKFVSEEMSKYQIFPPENKIFESMNLCSLSSVRVVIIGQDPYHGPNQAHGLAFSVRHNIPPPPSLLNIIKEAKTDVGISNPTHGNLEHWSRQGVLLLNTCLTVRKGEANSHQKKGWETFTDAVVKILAKKENIVYLLWGKPAQSKCSGIDRSKNVVITSSHPSPLGAYKTNEPFIGSRCFSRCNKALVDNGSDPIDWNII